LEQLKSDELMTRQNAARTLGSGRLAKAGPEVVAAMAAFADDPDESVRRAALTVLANFGARDQVPLMLKGLHDDMQGMGATMLRGLARVKDPRAAEPLAEFLASGQSDQQFYQPPGGGDAAQALVRIGPVAEAPVLAILKEKNISSRVQACLVLKQIGTKKSLPALKDLTLFPNKQLSEAAADACRSIQAREDMMNIPLE
jgi:HEAT repeat protein